MSLHVRATDTGHEYLRFDCFDNEPHYHYIHDSTDPYINNVVVYDPFACGDMLPFAIGCLRTRLAEMLPAPAPPPSHRRSIGRGERRGRRGRAPRRAGAGEHASPAGRRRLTALPIFGHLRTTEVRR